MKRFLVFFFLLIIVVNNFIAQQSCLNPTAISIANITNSGSNVTWTPGGAESSWNLEYGISGFSLGTGILTSISNNSFTMTGLNATTSYDVYLKADCGGGLSSNWVGPYSFLTYFNTPNNITCNTGNSTTFLSDDLDSTGYWSGDFGTSNGYWRVRSGPTGTTNTGPSGAHSGSNYFYFESSIGGLDTASIISPVIDLTNAIGTQSELSFYYHFFGSSGANLDISISSDLINYSNIGTLSMYQTSDSNPFVPVGIDLSAYVGQIIYLKFTYIRGDQGASFEGDIAIDLVEVKACSPTSSCYFYGDTTNISICGDSIDWNDNYYYNSGLYQDTVYNFATCDSVIYLDLTLNSLPVIDLGSDTLICDSTIITLDAGSGQSSYSWSTGESTQSISYMGTHQGDFGVTDDIITLNVVGNNGCSNTKDILISTISCDTSSGCYYTIDMQDSYGDGWNGAYLSVLINGVQYPQNLTVSSGSSNQDGFPTYNGDVVEFYFNSGSWDSEISFIVYGPSGIPLDTYGPNPPIGLFLTDTSNSLCVDTLSSCYFYGDTTNISICGDSIDWNDNYYYNSGLYQDTVYNFATCDSVIYLDLTLNSLPVIDLGSDTLICDSTIITLDAGSGQSSYSWSTGESTQSISYMGTHQGDFGVTDDIITLNVVGNNGCSNTKDILISTISCDTSSGCYYTIDMQDSYGDGWNGAYLSVLINGVQYPQNLTVSSGSSNQDGFPTYNGDVVEFYFSPGSYDSEITFTIYDPSGIFIGTFGPNPPVGLFLIDTSSSSCVDVTFSCSSPTNLSAHYLDSISAQLSWSPGGNESNWDVEYGLSGQALGQGNILTQVSNNQYLLTGLSQNNSYRYYVRSKCGSINSQWVGPFTFVTSKLFGTWKLAGIAGALQQGPSQGDSTGWSSSLLDVSARACLFNDSINFDGLGGMTHYMDGSTWLEPWQGAAIEECGTPVAPHSGGNFTYSYFNNQLTVNGLGAHLGLPKVNNVGELSSPNSAVNSITYEIEFTSDYDTMVVDIQSGVGVSNWWRFIYQRTNLLPPVPTCDSSVFIDVYLA